MRDISSRVISSKFIGFALSACCVLPTFGCATHTQTGALVGSGAGAGLGAIIGNQIGKGKEGALIGAALGAGTGALVGKNQDVAEERDAAYRQASHAEASRRAHARALSNRDVMDYTSSRVSDAVIISSIQERGGVFDTSPSGIISLKHAGVSDNVIQSMQRLNMAR